MRPLHCFALACAASFPSISSAQELGAAGVSHLDAVQVTATRFALPVQETPTSVSLVSGEELRARGATDLRSALELLGGITVATGGDDGPAASSPGLLGLREADDFLLLVDGTPVGAAFLPQFSTLDLTNVERIEVQRGAAAIFYGTTSFAGTINIIHYPAGRAASTVDARYGSFGSTSLSGSGAFGSDRVRQSLGGTLQRERYSDSRAGLDRAHGLYRVATDVGGGVLRADLDTTVQHQRPFSPSPVGDSGGFDVLPIDFNQNPADAKIDTNRFQLTLGYDRGGWSTNISATQTHEHRVQGSLNAADAEPGDNATGFHQARNLSEIFLDSHWTAFLTPSVHTTLGINELYGLAHQDSRAFSYVLPTDGALPPSSGALDADEEETIRDLRSFAGLYGQVRWALLPRVGIVAGLRLNRIDEIRGGADADDYQRQSSHINRLSGSIGSDWRIWQDPQADLDDVVLYADFANSFQPAQIDFGPDDALNVLLRPESARSYQLGMKADGLDGHFDFDVSGFLVDFDNQPMPLNNGLVPGGRERYTGFEIESHYAVLPSVRISASFGYNDARYRDFSMQTGDGEDDVTQLSGRQLVLTPRTVAGFGIVAGAETGPKATLAAKFVGRRFLDSTNSFSTPAYATVDASVGWAFRRVTLWLRGTNLSNRRDPVLESELGEDQYYRLLGRRFEVQMSAPLSGL